METPNTPALGFILPVSHGLHTTDADYVHLFVTASALLNGFMSMTSAEVM